MTLNRRLVGNTATWTGQVTIPAADGELRLLMVEDERLYADGMAEQAEATISRIVYAVSVTV